MSYSAVAHRGRLPMMAAFAAIVAGIIIGGLIAVTPSQAGEIVTFEQTCTDGTPSVQVTFTGAPLGAQASTGVNGVAVVFFTVSTAVETVNVAAEPGDVVFALVQTDEGVAAADTVIVSACPPLFDGFPGKGNSSKSFDVRKDIGTPGAKTRAGW